MPLHPVLLEKLNTAAGPVSPPSVTRRDAIGRTEECLKASDTIAVFMNRLGCHWNRIEHQHVETGVLHPSAATTRVRAAAARGFAAGARGRAARLGCAQQRQGVWRRPHGSVRAMRRVWRRRHEVLPLRTGPCGACAGACHSGKPVLVRGTPVSGSRSAERSLKIRRCGGRRVQGRRRTDPSGQRET